MGMHEQTSMQTPPPERFLRLVRRERRRRRAARGVGVAGVLLVALGAGAWWVSPRTGGSVRSEHLAQRAEGAPVVEGAFPRALDREDRGMDGGAGGPARALPRAGDAARWLRESGDGELCCV